MFAHARRKRAQLGGPIFLGTLALLTARTTVGLAIHLGHTPDIERRKEMQRRVRNSEMADGKRWCVCARH
jgi:hypothetical protein